MKKKSTSWEDKYSEIFKAYRYSEEVREYALSICYRLDIRHDELLETKEAIQEIQSRKNRLSTLSDFELLDQVFFHSKAYKPRRVIGGCEQLLRLLQELFQLCGDSASTLPIQGLKIFRDSKGNPCLVFNEERFDPLTENWIVSMVESIRHELDPWTNKSGKELEEISKALPGLLAYRNSSEHHKQKKSRSSEAIEKERDYLFLLDQYEKWQAKRREDTGRKRLNPKDWLEDFDSWTSKSRRLFDKWTESEEDPEDIVIVAIIKYAQKMKREKEGSDE